MISQINTVLVADNMLHHPNTGITVCLVQSLHEGLQIEKKVLYTVIDKKTVLYLSGGSKKRLYEQLAQEENIIPGAVGLVDERYGEPFHETSNEKMIRDTGFLHYLHMRDIPFYPILQPSKSREEVATAYDEKVRSLHSTFQ